MSLICTTITTYVTQQVTVPVNTWVSQQQQQCQQYPWWNPLGWFCWFVTIVVLGVVWVVQTIVVASTVVVCNFVTFVVGWVVMLFAIPIDFFCSSCTAVAWTNHWFLTQGKITFKGKSPSTSQPGAYDYEFVCHCSNGPESSIIVTAVTDDDAAAQAKLACQAGC